MGNTLVIWGYMIVAKGLFTEGGIWNSLLPYSQIGRDDVIVFRYPVQPTQHFVKRVIGIPGDRIHLYRGKFFVNGKSIDVATFAIHKSLLFDYYIATLHALYFYITISQFTCIL